MITGKRGFPAAWFLKLAVLRLATQWRSILTIIAGVLLATIVGASAPLYTAGVAQIGLVQRLEQRPPEAVNIFARASISASAEPGFGAQWSQFDRTVENQLEESFGAFPDWIDRVVQWGESTPMLLVRDGEDVDNVRLRVAYYDDLLADRVDLSAGSLPTDAIADDYDLEAVVYEPVAAALDLSVGDTITLDQRGWDTSVPIRTRITGIIQERDADQLYWMNPSPLRIDRAGAGGLEANLLTTRANLERITSEFVPQTSTQVGWRIFFDYTALPYTRIAEAVPPLNAFEAALQAALSEAAAGDRVSLVYNTNLPTILSGYTDAVTILGVPFGLLLIQLGALVLFFLVVMGALVRRTDRRETAIMQSRGAPDSHILVFRGIEALLICIAAAAVAPIIARQVLLWLIPRFTGVERLPLEVQPAVYLYAGGAALAAWIVLVVSLIPVLRQPLVLAGGGDTRSTSQAWWQRYYLDVIFLIVGLGAVWRLVSTDSPLAETQIGGTQADPLLLLGPALLFFALGSVSLRLFPGTMRLIAQYLAVRRGVAGTLASWQVSREPLHYGRITLLLALAISVGLFAINFQTTLARSQQDRAAYRAGSDVRLHFAGGRTSATMPDPSAVAALPEVGAVSVGTRFEGSDVSTNLGRMTSGAILAVDNETISDVFHWRGDLGSRDVPQRGEPLPKTGRVLPDGTQRLGLWALYEGYGSFFPTFAPEGVEVPEPAFEPQTMLMLSRLGLYARLIDENGKIATIQLIPDVPELQEVRTEFGGTMLVPPEGGFPNEGWLYYEVDVSSTGLEGTLTFQGLHIATRHDQFSSTFGLPTLLTIRDLTAFTSEGEQPLDSWLESDDWRYVNEVGTTTINRQREEPSISDALDAPKLQVYWSQDSGTGDFGLLLNYPERISVNFARGYDVTLSENEITTIPALVSESFARQNNLSSGQRFNLFLDQSVVWFEVADIVRYFPTLYNDEGPFIVVDQDLLAYTLQQRPRSTFQSNELWVRLESGVSDNEFLASLQTAFPDLTVPQAVTLDSVAATLQTDLLSLGVIGLLYFAFLVGIVLSIVSLLTYAGIAAQTRRSEFAVLRALGLPTRRIVWSITLEQMLVVAIGGVLGVIIGLLLSTQVLPTLSLSTGGTALTPPFLVRIDVIALVQFSLLLLGILAVQLVISSWIVARMTRTHGLFTGRGV